MVDVAAQPTAPGREAQATPWEQPDSGLPEAELERLERVAQVLAELRKRCPSLAVLAIRWLHVRHPIHPVQEVLLRVEGARGGPRAAQRSGLWKALAIGLLYAAYATLQAVRERLLARRTLQALARRPFAIVAKTWCFSGERPPEDRDFYYGDLQQRLARRGVPMLLVCGNVRGIAWRQFARGHAAAGPLARVPEACLAPIWAPARVLLEQWRAAWQLRRLAARASNDLLRRAGALASVACLSPETLRTALGYWVAWAAVRRWRPQGFMTFYEAHAWEKCMWWGAKQADPSCRTVGYQHTALFRESLSLLRPPIDLRERSVPDLALTLGRIPTALMQDGHARAGVRLLPLGSFRFERHQADAPADPARRTVLVTPEGLLSEAEALFTAAAQWARRLPAYTFVLRSHPELPIDEALARLPAAMREQPNLVVSRQRTIAEDFARSSLLLYRGSSTVLYAVLYGLRPFYLRCEGLRDVDPLYWLDAWRVAVGSPEEAAARAEQDRALPQDARRQEWTRAVEALRRYAEPVEEHRINEWLAALGLSEKVACAA